MEKENDIDALARMVADGFSSIQKNMDERFDQLEKEVRGISQRIDEIVIPELDEHARRIKDLELKVA